MERCRCLQYKNHSFNQFEQRKGVILLFCVTVCHAMSMERRKKARELSEEVRHKIVAKHGQSQGYKSISRDLDVPVSTVRNVIRKFKAHGTVANLPGCGPQGHKRKLDRRLQRRIVRMVEKAPRSTAKQIQADLQTQGTTVSTRTIRRQLNERGFHGRRPGRTPLLRERQKKARQAKILLGECPVDR